MGGVAGHMSHLYDNPDITFGEIKEILTAASDGKLEAEEKVDGQNLFLSYSIPDGKAKGARNKGNLKAGGLDAAGLAQKFMGRGNIERTFTKGFSAFEDAVQELDESEKRQIFGPNANIWYNAEIMDPGSRLESGEENPDDPGSTNVIKYDGKYLKIHDVGHFLFDPETGEKKPIPEGSLEALDSVVDDMRDQLRNHDFSLVRRAVINLNKIEDDEALHIAIRHINNAINAEGLGDSSTIQDYNYVRLVNGLDGDLTRLKKEELAKYLLKMPGNIGLRAIKKGLKPEDVQDVSQIVDRKRMILFQAIQPIEEAIHDFTVEILRGLESLFVVDSNVEVKRLQKELAKAVKSITEKGTDDPETMSLMQQHLRKIKDFSNINTPTEGIVFVYNDHVYKFTGNFAPLNQILGMFKYPRGGKTSALTKESLSIPLTSRIITEKEGNIKKEPSQAKQFILSLPKFTPTETWGNPESMERSQINKIFGAIGGGASVQKKIENILGTVQNPGNEKGFSSPQRIISTLIVLESLTAVINSFSSSAAGFVFEGFMSALLGGRQVADPTDGSLPIQDLIAFTEYEGVSEVPVSLKLLKEPGPVKGSYTNLIKGINEFGLVVYIVARKTGHSIKLEQFIFSQENLVNLFAAGLTPAGFGALFALPNEKRPGKWLSSEESLAQLQNASNWEEQFSMLQHSAGFSKEHRVSDSDDGVDIVDTIDTEDDQARAKAEDEKLRQSTNDRIFSVEENRKLWAEDKNLILEAAGKGGKQWHLSVAALKKSADESEWVALGELPANPEATERVAEQYMKLLQNNLTAIFEATSDLSDNVSNYFTYPDRSQATTAGKDAIEDAKTVSREMSAQVSQDQVSQDQGTNEHLVREDQSVTSNNPATGKRIALFPGKFKPPHKGHYELAKSIATDPALNVDEVVVLISPSSKPEVNPQQSLAMWNKYLDSDGAPDNIHAEIADYRSPITTVYEFVADPVKARQGDTILLLKSSKDIGDTRYEGAQSYAERNNSGVNVELIEPDPVEHSPGVPYHGEDARDSIAKIDRQAFDAFIPKHVDTDEVWNIFHPNNSLDTVIDEMSLGGSIEGSMAGSGAFGPPNTFDPYKRSTNEKAPKPKRPLRKRAKRQRRR